MTIAFDAAASSGSLAQADVSYTHTPSGTPAGIIVFGLCSLNADFATNAATYGGSAMTHLATITGSGGSQKNDMEIHAWLLGSSVPTGAQTVAITRTGTGYCRGVSVSVTAATDVELNTAGGAGYVTGESSGTTTPFTAGTLALGSVESLCAEMFLTGDSATWTAPTNWTEYYQVGQFSRTHAIAVRDVTTSDVTDAGVGFGGGTEEVVGLVVAIAEAGGGAAAHPIRRALYGPFRGPF